MRVVFASNYLQRCFEEFNEAVRAWGADVGRRYIQRINILRAAEAFNDLYTVRSLRLHALKGGRAGQYTIDVTGRVRLILTYQDDVRTIRVGEVSQHYGD